MGAHVLLANEFGAGRGHLTTLRQLALALGPGYALDAALCRRAYDNILTDIGATVFDGPRLIYHNARRQGPDATPTATWGEFLGDLGFDREVRVAEVVDWWRHVIVSRGIELVLADYAPLALLAARSLGVTTVTTGTGFGLPPWQMAQFPMLKPENATRLHDEKSLLANVNAVATRHCMLPLAGLPEVYRADLTLVRTLPFLDPYAPWRRDIYLPPVTDISPMLAGPGDEVFVYFSTSEFEDPQVVEALVALPLPRRGYLPGVPEGVAARLAASGMVLEPAPVPVADIVRRSRMVLNAGQHGILSLALFAGLPQVCLPQHQEHLWHATAAKTKGVALVVPSADRTTAAVLDAVRAVQGDDAMFARAQFVAQGLRNDLDGDPDTVTARHLHAGLAGLRV